MTNEQREEVERLARAAHDAAQAVHYAGYWAVPREQEKAREQSARYAVLRASAYETQSKLEAAISALGKQHAPEIRELAQLLMTAVAA